MPRREKLPVGLVLLVIALGLIALMAGFGVSSDDVADWLGLEFQGEELTATYGAEGLEDEAVRARAREVLAELEGFVDVTFDPVAGTLTCRMLGDMDGATRMREALEPVCAPWLMRFSYDSYTVRRTDPEDETQPPAPGDAPVENDTPIDAGTLDHGTTDEPVDDGP